MNTIISSDDVNKWRADGLKQLEFLKAGAQVQGLWWQGKKDGTPMPTDLTKVFYYFPKMDTEYGCLIEGRVSLAVPPPTEKIVLSTEADVLKNIDKINVTSLKSILASIKSGNKVTITA